MCPSWVIKKFTNSCCCTPESWQTRNFTVVFIPFSWRLAFEAHVKQTFWSPMRVCQPRNVQNVGECRLVLFVTNSLLARSPALFTKLTPTFAFQQVFANVDIWMGSKTVFQIREGSRVKNQESRLPNMPKWMLNLRRFGGNHAYSPRKMIHWFPDFERYLEHC